MKKILTKYPTVKRFVLMLFLSTFCLSFFAGNLARALSPGQKSLFTQNILYYDLACSAVGSGGSAAGSTGSPTALNGKKVYMVGDSILLAATDALKNKFQEAGVDNVFISAAGGSSLTYSGTTGTQMSGLEAAEHDKDRIRDADIIIIAHGTNELPNDLEESMKRMMGKVKNFNGSASIFWVNTFTSADTNPNAAPGSEDNPAYTTRGAEKKNEIIDRLSSSQGYSVIDAKSANIGTYDGIHPNVPDGNNKYAKTVADGVATGGEKAAATSGGDCSCSGSASLSGSDNTAKALSFFVSEGFTQEVAAGIVGNFVQESGVNPKRVEDGWGFPSESDAVPPATGPHGQPGYGIAQWTTPSRKEGLKDFAREKGMPVSDLSLQLQWVMEEMKSFPGLKEDLQRIQGSGRDAIEAAALLFHGVYEGSADTADMIQERVDSGVEALENSGGSVTGGSSSPAGCSGGGTGATQGNFIWPDDGRKDPLTSCFGQRWGRLHGGVDIGSAEGQNVTAADGGTVEIASIQSGFGNTVVIKHDNGKWTLYAHNSSLVARVGDKVDQGQVVSKVGGTGSGGVVAYAPHIHFNVQTAGGANYDNVEDPLNYLPRDGRGSSGTNCPAGSF